MKKILIVNFFIILFIPFSYGGGPGTTGASFLKIGIGAKSAAMGEAFTAVANDVSAIYWNPSAVGKLSQKEVAVMYNKWIAGINHEFLGYIHPFNNYSVGIGCIFMNMEPIPYTTIETTWLSNKSFTAYSYAVLVNFSKKKNNLFFGTNLKFIQEKIYDYSASAYALDFGLLYNVVKTKLDLGMSLLNIGTPIKFKDEADMLPLEIRVGSAYYFKEKIIIGFDISQSIDNNPELHCGMQYLPFSFIAFRAGYKYKIGGNDIERTGVSVGVGICYKIITLDYAFVPFGTFGDTHKVFLSFKFGKELKNK
jgi:hypothetical protein